MAEGKDVYSSRKMSFEAASEQGGVTIFFSFSFFQHPVCSIMVLLTALYLIRGPQNRRRFNIQGAQALEIDFDGN